MEKQAIINSKESTLFYINLNVTELKKLINSK